MAAEITCVPPVGLFERLMCTLEGKGQNEAMLKVQDHLITTEVKGSGLVWTLLTVIYSDSRELNETICE